MFSFSRIWVHDYNYLWFFEFLWVKKWCKNSIIFLQSTVHWGCLFQEMRENLPGFSFRLVEINIDKTELQRVRKETILDLLNPLNTVLDDSIGKFMFIKGLSGKLKVSGKKCLNYPCFWWSKNDDIFFIVTRIKVQMLPCESGLISLNKGSLWNKPTVPLIEESRFTIFL